MWVLHLGGEELRSQLCLGSLGHPTGPGRVGSLELWPWSLTALGSSPGLATY